MTAVDLKRELAWYRARRGRFDVVDVPPQRYLMVDGAGDPNTAPEYAASVAALFPLAYALKFLAKRELGRDAVVMPLEGLWWADTMASFTTARDKSAWSWTLMILQPEWIDADLVEHARAQVAAKADAPERLADVRFDELHEGAAVQTLHVGGYDDEAPVLARLHGEVIPGLGMRPTGLHHEIYLSDARRTDPAKLRTILRQPVAPA